MYVTSVLRRYNDLHHAVPSKKTWSWDYWLLFKCRFQPTLRAFLLLMIWTLSSPVRLFTSILFGFLQRCLFCLGRPSWKWNCICILLTPCVRILDWLFHRLHHQAIQHGCVLSLQKTKDEEKLSLYAIKQAMDLQEWRLLCLPQSQGARLATVLNLSSLVHHRQRAGCHL